MLVCSYKNCHVNAANQVSTLWDNNHRFICTLHSCNGNIVKGFSVLRFTLQKSYQFLQRLKWKPTDIPPVHNLMLLLNKRAVTHRFHKYWFNRQAHILCSKLILQRVYICCHQQDKQLKHNLYKTIIYFKIPNSHTQKKMPTQQAAPGTCRQSTQFHCQEKTHTIQS